MPLKTCTGPLPAPATFPAVVSTTGVCDILPSCARTACDASASIPAAPLPASNDRRSSFRCEAWLVIAHPLRPALLRPRPQLRSVLLDQADPGGRRAAVLDRAPGDGHLVAGLEVVLLDARAVERARSLRLEAP